MKSFFQAFISNGLSLKAHMVEDNESPSIDNHLSLRTQLIKVNENSNVSMLSDVRGPIVLYTITPLKCDVKLITCSYCFDQRWVLYHQNKLI